MLQQDVLVSDSTRAPLSLAIPTTAALAGCRMSLKAAFAKVARGLKFNHDRR
jgi:hypothetical protein